MAGRTRRRCELCEREFSSDQGLLRHYADKHPDARPPEDALRREAKRVKENRRPNGQGAEKRGNNKKILILAAIVIVIIILASTTALYFFSLGSRNSSSNKNDSRGTSSSSSVIYGINAGDSAPDISITLTNGTSTTLSKFHGQATLLWFVTTWCSSCRQGEQMLTRPT